MQDFRQLDVWVKAHQLVLDVYKATEHLPKSDVTMQLRRTAVAVPTRIAEGCGQQSNAEFARHLQRSLAAAFEVDYLLLLCRDLDMIPEDTYQGLSAHLIEVRRMSSGLLRKL